MITGEALKRKSDNFGNYWETLDGAYRVEARTLPITPAFVRRRMLHIIRKDGSSAYSFGLNSIVEACETVAFVRKRDEKKAVKV